MIRQIFWYNFVPPFHTCSIPYGTRDPLHIRKVHDVHLRPGVLMHTQIVGFVLYPTGINRFSPPLPDVFPGLVQTPGQTTRPGSKTKPRFLRKVRPIDRSIYLFIYLSHPVLSSSSCVIHHGGLINNGGAFFIFKTKDGSANSETRLNK